MFSLARAERRGARELAMISPRPLKPIASSSTSSKDRPLSLTTVPVTTGTNSLFLVFLKEMWRFLTPKVEGFEPTL